MNQNQEELIKLQKEVKKDLRLHLIYLILEVLLWVAFVWYIFYIMWNENLIYYKCWFNQQEINILKEQEETTNLEVLKNIYKTCWDEHIKFETNELKDNLMKKLQSIWINLYL